MKPLIYVADDDITMLTITSQLLRDKGYDVISFTSGDDLFDAFKKKSCDLVVLDVVMSGTCGLETCKQIRESSHVPIIMLTSRDSVDDYVAGVRNLSDAYLTKPPSIPKLLAHVETLLVRHNVVKAQEDILQFGDITLNSRDLTVVCSSGDLKLTEIEFNFLKYLMAHKRPIPRTELLSEVWGYGDEVETRSTDDAAKRLRKKLSEAKSTVSLATVWGLGFRLEEQGSEEA